MKRSMNLRPTAKKTLQTLEVCVRLPAWEVSSFLFLAALFLLLPAQAGAIFPGQGVVVHFKDGAELSGVFVGLTGGRVTLDVGVARVGWPMASVSRLEARPTEVERFKKLEASGRDRREEPIKTEVPIETEVPRAEDPVETTALRTPVRQSWRPRLSLDARGHDYHHAHSAACRGFHPYLPTAFFIPAGNYAFGGVGREQEQDFFKELQARRRAVRRARHMPLAELQLRIQEALDRRARGATASRPSGTFRRGNGKRDR